MRDEKTSRNVSRILVCDDELIGSAWQRGGLKRSPSFSLHRVGWKAPNDIRWLRGHFTAAAQEELARSRTVKDEKDFPPS